MDACPEPDAGADESAGRAGDGSEEIAAGQAPAARPSSGRAMTRWPGTRHARHASGSRDVHGSAHCEDVRQDGQPASKHRASSTERPADGGTADGACGMGGGQDTCRMRACAQSAAIRGDNHGSAGKLWMQPASQPAAGPGVCAWHRASVPPPRSAAPLLPRAAPPWPSGPAAARPGPVPTDALPPGRLDAATLAAPRKPPLPAQGQCGLGSAPGQRRLLPRRASSRTGAALPYPACSATAGRTLPPSSPAALVLKNQCPLIPACQPRHVPSLPAPTARDPSAPPPPTTTSTTTTRTASTTTATAARLPRHAVHTAGSLRHVSWPVARTGPSPHPGHAPAPSAPRWRRSPAHASAL